MPKDLPITEKAFAILQDYVDRQHGGNVSSAAIALGIDPSSGTLHRWLRKGCGADRTARYPGLERLGPVLDRIGARLVGPGETTAGSASPSPAPEAAALLAKLEEARKEIATLRRERDEARGACAVLDRLVERLAEKRGSSPAPSSPSRLDSAG